MSTTSPEPVWRGEVALRWEGHDLFLGSVNIGKLFRWEHHKWRGCLFSSPGCEFYLQVTRTEPEARAALVAAAIEALTGGGDGNG